MDRIKELKADAYDVLAKIEGKQLEIQELQRMIQKINQEIQKEMENTSESPTQSGK